VADSNVSTLGNRISCPYDSGLASMHPF
jgi:hypothetical protein